MKDMTRIKIKNEGFNTLLNFYFTINITGNLITLLRTIIKYIKGTDMEWYWWVLIGVAALGALYKLALVAIKGWSE